MSADRHQPDNRLDRRPRRGDGAYVACLIGFPWRDAHLAYEATRWMALIVLLFAGWGLWHRLTHGVVMDPATLGMAFGAAAFGLLRPDTLRGVVNPLARELVAAVTARTSERPAVRASEIDLRRTMASLLATLGRAARSRARAIRERVLAALAVVSETLRPRLSSTLVARHAALCAA